MVSPIQSVSVIKGKQVRILYRPAAVSSFNEICKTTLDYRLSAIDYRLLNIDYIPSFIKNVLNNTFATVYRQKQQIQKTEFFNVNCQVSTGRRSTTGASQKTCHSIFVLAFGDKQKTVQRGLIT